MMDIEQARKVIKAEASCYLDYSSNPLEIVIDGTASADYLEAIAVMMRRHADTGKDWWED